MKTKPHTRREFLKRSALAAASLPLAAALDLRAQTPAPGRKLGFALAGLGSLSTHQIAPALQKTNFCKLTGLITGHPAKAATWKAQYNIPDKNIYNYDNMETMADNADIDVVYVVTPNGLHAEHTIKAAKAGKHVLCEKPMEERVSRAPNDKEQLVPTVAAVSPPVESVAAVLTDSGFYSEAAVQAVEQDAAGQPTGTTVYAAVEKKEHHRTVPDLEKKDDPTTPAAGASVGGKS